MYSSARMYSSASPGGSYLRPQSGSAIKRDSFWNWAVLLYLLAIASVYGALFLSGSRSGPSSAGSFFWAFEHLALLKSPLLVIGIACVLSLAGCLLLHARPSRWPRWLRWLALGALLPCVGLLTWYLRLDTSLGDRRIFLEMLTHGQVFRMSQPLTTALYAVAYKAVKAWSWPPRNAVALVCSLAAITVTWIMTEWLIRMPREQAVATSTMLLPCSLLVLFFGYVETTVLALAAVLSFFFLSYMYLQRRVHLCVPAIALGVATACHGSCAYLLPSLLLLALQQTPSSSLRRPLVPQWAGALAGWSLPVALTVGMALFQRAAIRGSAFGDSLGGPDMRPFVPLANPRPPYERYTMLSMSHLRDILNLMLLVSPFAPVACIVGAWHVRQVMRTAWGRFLGLSALSGLGFVILWNADLGMKADWDLFGPALVPLLLFAAHALAGKLSRGLLAVVAAVALTNSLALLAWFGPTRVWSPSTLALPVPAVQYPMRLSWPDRFELVGFDLSSEQPIPGGKLNLALYLRGLKPMPVGYTLFLHLLDADGKMIAQDDHQPVPPTEYWAPGEVVTSTFALTVPPTLSVPAQIRVEIGAYFWQTLERLPLLKDGQSANNRVSTLIEVHVK